jgi:hypothetical protein
VGDRLVVSLDMLTSTARSLAALRAEFEAAPDVADEVRGAVGHDGLSDAIGDFAGNWRYHRRKLCESIQSVEQMAADSAQVYADTDRELAASLTTEGSQ